MAAELFSHMAVELMRGANWRTKPVLVPEGSWAQKGSVIVVILARVFWAFLWNGEYDFSPVLSSRVTVPVLEDQSLGCISVLTVDARASLSLVASSPSSAPDQSDAGNRSVKSVI